MQKTANQTEEKALQMVYIMLKDEDCSTITIRHAVDAILSIKYPGFEQIDKEEFTKGIIDHLREISRME